MHNKKASLHKSSADATSCLILHADSPCDCSPAVLLSSNFIRDTMRIFLPEHRSADENARMSDVARQADMAWRQPAHPDWYAAREDQDGEALLNDFRQLVGLPSLAPFALPTPPTFPFSPFQLRYRVCPHQVWSYMLVPAPTTGCLQHLTSLQLSCST